MLTHQRLAKVFYFMKSSESCTEHDAVYLLRSSM